MDHPGALLLAAQCGAVLGPLAAALVWFRLRPQWRAARHARAALLIFALTYGLAVWAFLIEPEMLVVRRVAIESPTWRGPPLRIGVLSDVHVGAHVSPARVASVVARLSAERPDIIVYLGDYAGGHEPAAVRRDPRRSAILRGVAALAGGRAPLGQVAVLGNHDWWYDGPAIEAQLRRSHIPVLENQALRVARPGGPFWIAGLADEDSRRSLPSIGLALRGVSADEPVIVLTHWPDPFPSVPPRVALTLAAHSHCGQINLPFLRGAISASPGSAMWPCGLYDVGGRQLYVTGGLGVSIVPARFRAPPEIVIVTLRAAGVPLTPPHR